MLERKVNAMQTDLEASNYVGKTGEFRGEKKGIYANYSKENAISHATVGELIADLQSRKYPTDIGTVEKLGDPKSDIYTVVLRKGTTIKAAYQGQAPLLITRMRERTIAELRKSLTGKVREIDGASGKTISYN